MEEKKKIKLIALDLDGTLTNGKKQVTERNCRAVQSAISAGVSVVLASGRPTIGIRAVADRLGLAARGGFIEAYNGGEILDLKRGTTVYKKSICRELIPEICSLSRALNLHLLTYSKEGVLTERPDGEYVEKEAFCNGVPIEAVEDLEKRLTWEPVKFLAADEPQKLAAAKTVFEEQFGQRLNLFFSEPYFLEIVPPGIEKAYGLDRLMAYLSLKPGELMAIGDGYNDLPMLRHAGLSVAMGNAYDAVKQEAQYVTADNEHDGVAEAIERFVL